MTVQPSAFKPLSSSRLVVVSFQDVAMDLDCPCNVFMRFDDGGNNTKMMLGRVIQCNTYKVMCMLLLIEHTSRCCH